ncbi:hypothetical protein ACFCYB_00160 [Streptomyces sp. NPDC056309]|uniref:hypothetical protein n=1 Tax=Streptomyces sp. NPDC056309 TaxID=3345781 RepID=UPI0035D57D1B
MTKTLKTIAGTALLLAALTACSSQHSSATATATAAAATKAGAAADKPLTASSAFTHLSSEIASAKLSGTVTEENDPNNLLGRPNQYTSKITFTDSRIKPADVEGTDKGAVERGGAIEVFTSPENAQARAKYIESVTKSMPTLTEYDYVHGSILVRVSHYLTPKQAAEYKAAANGLG